MPSRRPATAPAAARPPASPLLMLRGAPHIGDPDDIPSSPPLSRSLTLPNGRQVALAPRGVRWMPYTLNGQAVCCAFDGRGDIASHWRVVPLTASAEEFDAVERQLWCELALADPPVRLV
jgi:hypothetical protein